MLQCAMCTTSWSSAAGPPARRPPTGWPSAVTGVLVVEKQALPPGEDLRRRAHAAGGPPAPRHRPGRAPRRLPALRRAAVDRPRRDARAGLARAPRLPALRLRRAPPRPRRDGRGPGGEGRGDAAGRPPRRSSPLRRGRPRHRRGASRTSETGTGSRCGPGTSWSPTVPTPGSGGRSARPATATTRWAWRCGATSTARTTTSPGSRATSTSATASGNHLPGYGWVFPVGDGTVNVGVGLLSTFTGWKSINTSKLMDAFVATAPARWGISPGDVVRAADRGQAADRRVGACRRSGRPGSSVGDAAGVDQPVQRRGHRVRVRDGPARRRRDRRGARARRRARAAPLRGAARRDLRPLLQGGARRSCVPSATRR